MKVKNMISNAGNPIANQFIVDGEHYGEEGQFFQSYDSVIAFKPANGSSITLDSRYWDYSVTTGKYRNQFLGETKKETQAKIDSGEYILANLN
jgi:hypothetical protein